MPRPRQRREKPRPRIQQKKHNQLSRCAALRRLKKPFCRASFAIDTLYSKQHKTLEQNLIAHQQSLVWRNFGVVPNHNKSIRSNAIHFFSKTPLQYAIQQPRNQAFHNLCTTTQPPTGANKLLGLGLNYCVPTPFAYQGQDLSATKTRLHCTKRLIGKFGETDSPFSTGYDASLYKANPTYTPKL